MHSALRDVKINSKPTVHSDAARMLRLYRGMLEIRLFEEELYRLFMAEAMPGTIHQYDGQEAVAVGVCEALETNDYITSTHRGHGHCLAKGARMNEMMAELFGKRTGCCHGMGGSMHLCDFDVGILGATGVVGAGIPIAVGAGLSAKMRGTSQVVACFFGEGAANQGAFHEGLNLAAVWDLPVLFVCENNLYAVSMHIHKSTRVRNIADRAAAYGIEGVTVDGNNVLAVHSAAVNAAAKARTGGGPTLIECMTYRHRGHSRAEPATYRPKDELARWKEADPILRLKSVLLEKEITSDSTLRRVQDEIRSEVAEAIRFARESPDVSPEDALKYVFVEGMS